MRLPHLREWPAPLLLLAFSGVAVTYVNLVFSTSTRWVVLGLAVLLIFRDSSFSSLFRLGFVRITLVFTLWAMATYFWSEVPELSLMKGVALMFVVLGGLGAGYLWVRHHPLEAALDCLAPMSFMVLGAGVLGRDMIQNPDDFRGLTMYQGLTGNPNMFGVLAAMAFPFAAWKFSHSRSRYWLGFTLLLVAFALLSNSRAAIGTVLFGGLGLFGAQGVRKTLPWILLGGIALGVFAVAMPDTLYDLETRFVYKSDREKGVTSSRDEVWEISYEQALKGGMIGGGYGVTIGSLDAFQGGLTAAGFGREKGNSQFGIMEETGIIGLCLYLASTLSLLALIWRARGRCRVPRFRPLLGLMFGMISGLTFQSVFEAWYNAPGSPECMYYWVMAGIAVGLATDPRLSSAATPSPQLRSGGNVNASMRRDMPNTRYHS